jgi:hypothetical protein
MARERLFLKQYLFKVQLEENRITKEKGKIAFKFYQTQVIQKDYIQI